MNKFIIPLIISVPLFLSTPSFAASNPALYNPESRTDTMYLAGYNAVSHAGANYAYWHRWHHWHRWHRWHHWHHWHRR
jgi:hypothetical protein